MIIQCNFCQQDADIATGAVNRSRRLGMKLYCNRICAGKGRRANRSKEEAQQLKAAYDRQRRETLRDVIKEKRREYFQRTYDPAKAAIERRKRRQQHLEYCRTPEYRQWKKEYDKQHRAKRDYGEFWEVALLVIELEQYIDNREATQINRLYEKGATRRKRQWKSNLRLKI